MATKEVISIFAGRVAQCAVGSRDIEVNLLRRTMYITTQIFVLLL